MEEKNKTYTASDFVRYHGGAMSNAEMHDLEKAALEDPFLADALEGYALSNSPEKDIAELQRQLTDKRKKKKALIISLFTQNKWWSVAALFVIILGVAFLFYRTGNNVNTENLLATNKKLPAKVEEPLPVLKDSSGVSNDVAFQNKQITESLQRNEKALPKINTVTEREKINNRVQSKPPENPNLLSSVTDDTVSDTIAFQRSANKKNVSKEYVLKGRVTDDTGQPIPYASINEENQKKGTFADSSGQFGLVSADSVTRVVASAMGYAPTSVKLEKDREQVIAMNRNQESQTEIVVASIPGAKRKKMLPASESIQGKAAGVQVNAAIKPFPVSEEFTEYLEENLVPVYDANNKRLTGEVLLSFTINKKGRPENITILKSTCKSCEEQAIHLLKNGPDWTAKKNVPGSVEIKF